VIEFLNETRGLQNEDSVSRMFQRAGEAVRCLGRTASDERWLSNTRLMSGWD